MSTLRISSNTLAFDDSQITSDPSQKYVDWSRSVVVSVSNPQQNAYTIAPLDTLDVFSGARSTAISNTTQFSLTLSTLSSNRYRFTWTGTGTNPAFRTDRGLVLTGHTVTWAINTNQTASLTSSNTGDFTAVQIGDVLFIPGISTGDSAGPFNVLNEGFWQVLGVDGTGTTLQLGRTGTFSGFGQVVALTNNTSVQAFSSSGVQIGDSVDISTGFSAPVLTTYSVAQVTSTWFEVLTTVPLPVSEVGVPGTSGMLFYFNLKRFLRLEANQVCSVRLNGDTSDFNRLTPWLSGDSNNVAEFVKVGPVWSLTVVNKSSNPLQLMVVSAE